MTKQALFITTYYSVYAYHGHSCFQGKQFLNFDDINNSKIEYYYDPLILLAFLFFFFKTILFRSIEFI